MKWDISAKNILLKFKRGCDKIRRLFYFQVPAIFLGGTTISPRGYGDEKTFFQEHRYEIIFAAIFAVIALILWEIVRHPFENLYRRFLGPKVEKLKKKIKSRGQQIIHEAAILRSLSSNFSAKVPPEYIADAVKKHNALTVNERFHYTDISEKYHFYRRFKLFSLLNGDEAFFTEMCKAIAEKINFHDINLTLCLKKNPNSLFARKLSDHYFGRIKAHTLAYKETKRWFRQIVTREVKYEDGESLVGTHVIFLESLLISPDTIIESIKWVQAQGATVKKVVILFDATGSLVDFSLCGVDPQDVIIGASVNLEFALAEACKCNNKTRVKVLKYNDY